MTVQNIPRKVFDEMSLYSLGDPYIALVAGQLYPALIQPIKIDGQELSIGLHNELHISHFFLFRTPDAYKTETSQNLRVLTIFGGKVTGRNGQNQLFKNRVYYDIIGKVDEQQNFLHASMKILAVLDNLIRTNNTWTLQAVIPLEELPVLEIFRFSEQYTN
jgi:hypothetical protein